MEVWGYGNLLAKGVNWVTTEMPFAKLWRVSAPEADSTPAGKARHHPASATNPHEPTPDTQHQCGLRIAFFLCDVVLFSFANSTVECTLLRALMPAQLGVRCLFSTSHTECNCS